MRVGLMADAHGNLMGLDIALRGMGDVDLILHAGDTVGYYPFPDELLDEFRMRDVMGVAGNNDLILQSRYRRGDWPMGDPMLPVRPENIAYLMALEECLRIEVDDVIIEMHHGSPFSPHEYVWPGDAGPWLLENTDADVMVLGHTHKQMLIGHDGRLIVNPGSVGHPKGDDRGGRYAILNTDDMSVTMHEFDLNEERLEAACIFLSQ